VRLTDSVDTHRGIADDSWAVLKLSPAQEGGNPQWTVEDVKARQSKAVRAWLDKQVGPQKLELAKLLQEHAVIVRGGSENAQRLMDALIVRAVVASI